MNYAQSLKEALSVKEEALRKAEADLSSREAAIREAAIRGYAGGLQVQTSS